MKHPRFARSFEVVLDLPEPLRPIERLAYNFRWTWDHETRRLFRDADPELWEQVGHNPIRLLHSLSTERLDALAQDSAYLDFLNIRDADLTRYLGAETWYSEASGHGSDTLIAYFCAEFGLSEALPIYSGGLGVLAGDHLKAASDLGLPLVGVGLLYSKGYFRQFLGPDGWQQEYYPHYDYHRYPLRPVHGEDGQPLRIEVQFPERPVQCQIWRADVGRVPLFLLDSNVLENWPSDQQITDTLYGGDEDMRIRQELILGAGGFRALSALGLKPTVCHMNEGHAGFMTLERIKQLQVETGAEFRVARQCVVNGNVFTTHTPVPAGFDRFSDGLLRRYTESGIASMGIEFDLFESFGRINPANGDEAFNMAVFAIKNSNYVNGVSKLHAQVSRELFAPLWEDFAEEEVPIDAITNGVHTLSWTSREMAGLLDRNLGGAWRERPEDHESWSGIDQVPSNELWEVRNRLRTRLVKFVRFLLRRRDERDGFRGDEGRYDDVLDPKILTIGFARRFATYKRATLLFRDRERLKKLLFHPDRPVQLVIAGKSHPKDDGGKRLIQEIFEFIHQETAHTRVVFLEDYDIRVARTLVQGVDVWLNNPRRPMEASGTSGMKGLPNGVLNCSILDGWWDEAYEDGVGWAIGSRRPVDDEARQDWLDSDMLYRLLEEEITSAFYTRNEGVPEAWIEMVKRSVSRLAPRFSTRRMVMEYAERFYMPASKSYRSLMADDLKGAREVLQWRDRVRDNWGGVRIMEVRDDGKGKPLPLGGALALTANVELGVLSPTDVRVEALVGRAGSDRELYGWRRVALELIQQENGTCVFGASVKADQAGQMAYVIRVVPRNDAVRVETELKLVQWQQH